MKYPCIESTIEINFENFNVSISPMTLRLWVNKQSANDKKADERFNLALEVKTFLTNFPNYDELVRYCSTIKDINAFQIIETYPSNGLKFGTVFYTVDFSSDIHG